MCSLKLNTNRQYIYTYKFSVFYHLRRDELLVYAKLIQEAMINGNQAA